MSTLNRERGDIGVVGLGAMGHGLALNAADRGFSVAVSDRDGHKVEQLAADARGKAVRAVPSIEGLVTSLAAPRAVVLLVPAGAPVDAVIDELRPHLGPGDLIIDAGNSFFRDTERRVQALAEQDLHYMGLGISGGKSGVRHGPSLMPGGAREDYERVRPLLEGIAARVDGLPCVTYLGPGGAGHYVKMVHNGIEYAVMQLIAETYDLMQGGFALSHDEMAAVYDRWNEGALRSFLLEITVRVLQAIDEKTGQKLVHVIADEAGQKGTGRWCSQDAMELGVPVPNIDAAVSARELSGLRRERAAAARLFSKEKPKPAAREEGRSFAERLRGALEVASEVAYAQGMSQLRRASIAYGFGLDLAEVARIWRGGCIIRASLLERIQAAYRAEPALDSFLFEREAAQRITDRLPELRAVVREGAERGIPVPGLMSSLAYLDSLSRAPLPTNLIQAQRDYFGDHGFERIDAGGTFHGSWGEALEATNAR